jgi:hypothetical protein
MGQQWEGDAYILVFFYGEENFEYVRIGPRNYISEGKKG